MSAVIGTIEGSGERIMIAAKNVVSIQTDTNPDVIIVTTTLGDRIRLTEPGAIYDALFEWFETFLKLESQR